MKWPFGWLLPALALAATAVAIWAGANFAIAIPAAVFAIIAAGLIFAEIWVRSSPPPRVRSPRVRSEPERVRVAFRSGRLGREDVVGLLDRLERAGPNPNLPGRRVDELQRFAEMSPREFRQYVRLRLDELEVRT